MKLLEILIEFVSDLKASLHKLSVIRCLVFLKQKLDHRLKFITGYICKLPGLPT